MFSRLDMGGCSYKGCSNQTESGYQMCLFPKDKNRRNVWFKNCNYNINNVESPNIRLCHAHFEDNMWCRLGPTKRRLRPDAVPTIFVPFNLSEEDRPTLRNSFDDSNKDSEYIQNVNATQKIPFGSAKQSSSKEDHQALTNLNEVHKSCSETVVQNIQITSELNDNAGNSVTTYPCHTEGDSLLNLHKQLMEMQQKQKLLAEEANRREELSKKRYAQLEELFAKEHKSKIYFRNKYYASEKRLKEVLKKVSSEENCDISGLREILSKRFTADQVNDIIYSHKRYPKWSNDTLMMAFRLRFACGSSGYEQMLKEKYPLPSIRTLTRHVEFLPKNLD